MPFVPLEDDKDKPKKKTGFVPIGAETGPKPKTKAPAPDSVSAPAKEAEDEAPVDEYTAGEMAIEAARNFNVGLTKVFGLNNLSKKVGIGREEPENAPDLGYIEGGMEMLGAGAGFGGALLTGGGIAQGANLAQNTVANLFRGALQSTVARPASVTATEAASSFLAGVVGEMGEEAGGAAGRVAGELAGGLAPSAGLLSLKAVGSVFPAVRAVREAISGMRGRPSERALDIASDRVSSVVANEPLPTAAASGADILPAAREKMSFGERANSPGLLALEARVLHESEDLGLAQNQKLADINEMVRTALDDFTVPEAGGQRADPQAATLYLHDLVEGRIEAARQRVTETLQDMAPRRAAKERSTLAEEQLFKAEKDASVQEDELYAAVPFDVRSTPSVTNDVYKNHLLEVFSDRSAAEYFDMPPQVERLVGRMVRQKDGKYRYQPGKLAGGASVRELHSARSQVLRHAREERAKKGSADRAKLRTLNILQKALLDDISRVPEAGDALQTALNYSREVMPRFRNGAVGKILGYDKDGSESIASALTLERTIGTGTDAQRAERARELMAATKRDPEMQSLMEDYIIDEFVTTAQPGGAFNHDAAAKYLTKRAALLEEFPLLRDKLHEATRAGNAYSATQGMQSRNKSATGIVLQSKPGLEARALFNRKGDGFSKTTEIMRELATDPSGRATLGFQQALVDELFDRSARSLGNDVRSVPFVSGNKLNAQLNNRAIRAVLDAALSKEQREQLKRISDTALRMDAARSAAATPEATLALKENLLSNISRRLLAAYSGSQVNQRVGIRGNIHVPAIMIDLSHKLLEKGVDPARQLVVDAITKDPELMKLLLTRITTKEQEAVNLKLTAWALESAREYGINLAESAQERPEEQKQQPVPKEAMN